MFTDENISNQGERILETERPQMVREHKDRYRFARSFIRPGDSVLDCACGSGYGTKMLSSNASQTLGMDVSPTAIEYCREKYAGSGCEFKIGNAEALELPSASIDIYCSFETIEHVPNPRQLLTESRRVLRNGGTFLVSTPNRVFSNLKSGERPSNPFHFREWSLGEFDAELRGYFSEVRTYCQRVKSNNKFHPKYVESKLRRLFKLPDLVPISYTKELAEELEGGSRWMPMVFLAVCRQ